MSDADWHMKQAIERAGTQGGQVHALVAIAAALTELADAVRTSWPAPKPIEVTLEASDYHAEMQRLWAEMKELRRE